MPNYLGRDNILEPDIPYNSNFGVKTAIYRHWVFKIPMSEMRGLNAPSDSLCRVSTRTGTVRCWGLFTQTSFADNIRLCSEFGVRAVIARWLGVWNWKNAQCRIITIITIITVITLYNSYKALKIKNHDFDKYFPENEIGNVSLTAQTLSSTTKMLSLMTSHECEFRTLRLRMDELMSSAP